MSEYRGYWGTMSAAMASTFTPSPAARGTQSAGEDAQSAVPATTARYRSALPPPLSLASDFGATPALATITFAIGAGSPVGDELAMLLPASWLRLVNSFFA